MMAANLPIYLGVIGCNIGDMITNSLQITQDILNLIARIDEFKGAWRALGALAPERLSAFLPCDKHKKLFAPHNLTGSLEYFLEINNE
jgi:hypothetical protein